MSVKHIIIALQAILLFGCTVGKDYKKPDTSTEQKWNPVYSDDALKANETEISPKWWKNFNDDKLTNLVEKSLAYNHDIKTAEARIKEAVANHNAAFASLLPQVNGVGSLKREQMGAVMGQRIDETSDVGVRGNWDLDIFGGNKRRKEAALAAVQSTEARRDKIKLAIISETAKHYFKLRQSQQQKKLVLENIKLQEETLDGVREKLKVFEATNLEVVRAEAQVEDTKIRLTRINTDITIILNRLHVLTGEEAPSLNALLSDDGSIPPINDEAVTSIPLQLVEKNPDIRAAERDLASRTALSGAAFAEMFPKISLDGVFSAAESNLFGAATPWSVAGNLVMPLINFGSLKSQLAAADARQEQAFETYKQTVLVTMESVQNSFTSYKNEKKRAEQLASVLEKRKDVVAISKEQYKAGNTTQLDLLLAQQNQLDAENNFVISQSSIAQNAVDLYQSIGLVEQDNTASETPLTNQPLKNKFYFNK